MMWLLWREGEGRDSTVCGPWGLWHSQQRPWYLTWPPELSPHCLSFVVSLTLLLWFMQLIAIILLTCSPTPPPWGLKLKKAWPVNIFFYLHSTCGIVPGTENILNLCWMNDYCGWVYYFHWGSSGKAGVSRLSCSYWENAERRDRKSSVLIFA